jgi:hypothetical protein
MHVIHLTATPGPDGRLHLSVPVGTAVGEFEVTVSVKPKPPADPNRTPTPEERGWPPGYFENVIGSIDDDSFMIHPQPPLPPPPEPLG